MAKHKETNRIRPISDLPRGPASRLPRAIPIGAQERPGNPISFSMKDGSVIGGTIIAVWHDGASIRRDDTGTTQFLHRGDYELAAE